MTWNTFTHHSRKVSEVNTKFHGWIPFSCFSFRVLLLWSQVNTIIVNTITVRLLIRYFWMSHPCYSDFSTICVTQYSYYMQRSWLNVFVFYQCQKSLQSIQGSNTRWTYVQSLKLKNEPSSNVKLEHISCFAETFTALICCADWIVHYPSVYLLLRHSIYISSKDMLI